MPNSQSTSSNGGRLNPFSHRRVTLFVPGFAQGGSRRGRRTESYTSTVKTTYLFLRDPARQVYIKRVRTGDQESTIAMMLNAGHLRGHPDNHSVPVLEIFEDPEDSNISYMVMPFLSRMSDPPFLTVGEVVDFVDQILAGLVFMHEHNVAHRDCSEPNIMMDASAMYPLGVHPVYDVYLPDGITPSSDSMISRSKAGVKYYFVDYGISSHIPSDQPSKLVVGLLGRDRAVPELSDTVPYDPFKVDIFSIGLLLRKEFTKVYSNVAFLEPLINKMMKRSPGDRPTAIEALSQWRDIRRRVSVVARYWRLRPRGEHAIARVVWGTVHVMSSASQATKWVFEVPHAKLARHEIGWKNIQPFLASKGYMLRPRLRPGWTPSWQATGELYLDCEDHITLPARTHLVDATRISDSRLVYIKRVRTGDQESTVATLLNADSLRRNPDNHSVPVLEVFEDADDPTISYMVMPFLRRMSRPEFSTVGEVVDFVDQILAGLVFMHDQNIAHRDLSEPNIMMDASAMYPLGFHPIYDLYLPDARTAASRSMIPRLKAGVKYYFVDYGISSQIPSDHPTKLVTGIFGRDRDVPELSDTVPYDPFKVDIFSLGNLFQKEFVNAYSNVIFLTPLITRMMKATPRDRPTAVEALSYWRDIRKGVSAVDKYWRLRPRGEHVVARTIWGTTHVLSSASQVTKWVFGKK
ncbi:kinase-like domain-containing protein [Amylostereum chailletii]|nr:kinase-like domain-containing protein [Amylostereum chailletii]